MHLSDWSHSSRQESQSTRNSATSTHQLSWDWPSKGIAQALLEAGADPNATVSNPDEDVSGETALMDAIDSPEKIGVVESLLQRGADPARANSKGESALFQAVDYGNLEAVRRLLAAGAKPSGVLLHPLIFRCT